MLAAIRAFAKSWVAALLMGLLIVSFALWGIRDVFRGRINDAVITAGSRSISATEFRGEFDSFKKDIEQQAGQSITPQLAVENGLDTEVIRGLSTREAFSELLHRIGLRPSDKLVVAEIQKIPAFFDLVTGRFDKTAYARRLSENGLTVPGFEQKIRDSLADQQLGSGILAGLVVPRAYGATAAIYSLEARDLAFLILDAKSTPQPAPPTDAQLTAFMRENAARLTRPEFRQLTVVRFSPDLVTVNTPIDPAELQKRYDFRKDTLSKPETRSLVQVPAKDAQTAAQIAARLAKGEAPQAVARAFGVEAISYENKPQSAIADHKLAAAAFQVKSGQTQTVQGELGLAVVRVDQVTPGHAVTLEEVRPALEAEIRKDAAVAMVDVEAEAYDNAHEKGANLIEAAQKAGVKTVSIGPVAKQGLDQQGKPVAGLSQKLLETAFSLPPGGESELVDAGNNEYFAVRIEKTIPPALPPLAEIRPELARVWMARELGNRLKVKADELAARVRKGESLEQVAASNGAKVTRVAGLTRQSAGQNPAMSPEILANAFNAKTGEVFAARADEITFVVGKLEAVRPGDSVALPQIAEAARPQLTAGFSREIGAAARAAAREKVKIRVDVERARAAIGVEPGSAKPTGGLGLAK